MRNPDGYAIMVDPGAATMTKEWDTFQCVHCGNHNRIIPGSKRKRGWCTHCMGPICGPKCSKCRPFEKWLEQVERKSRSDYYQNK